MNYRKVQRYVPVPDAKSFFATKLQTLEYIPVLATPPVIPMDSVLSSFLSLQEPCRVWSSTGTNTSDLFNSQIGWIADTSFRSYHWYQSGSRFVTLAFGDLTKITMITLSQLPANVSSTIPFNQFQVSFSTDHGQTYAYLPPIYTGSQLGEEFNYTIPSIIMSCHFLRIHILNVADRDALANSVTGLSIVEIYGEPAATYTTSKSLN